MEIVVNNQRTTKTVKDLKSGDVFCLVHTNVYWIATDEWSDSGSRYCVFLEKGALDVLCLDEKVVIVKCKLEINE